MNSEVDVAAKVRLANLQVHQREAKIYDRVHPEIWGSFEQQRIRRDLKTIDSILSQKDVIEALDLGCGTGNLTTKYLDLGYKVKAVDISKAMIDCLLSKVDYEQAERLETYVGDAMDVLADPSAGVRWDLISFSAVLHHLYDYRAVVQAAASRLRPGGLLYVLHEPLKPTSREDTKRDPTSFVFTVADMAYIFSVKGSVYLREWLRTGRRQRRFDYAWSDYHIRNGIDVETIIEDLAARGADVLLFGTYEALFSSLLSAWNARRGSSRPSHFRLLAQRQAAR